MDGIIGKINQQCNTFRVNLNNVSARRCIISTTLLSQLELEPTPFDKGSIGYIYISRYNIILIKLKMK
tara:strand:+ start:123 stop:326 length:204 start_codon:yes stop_codon:yes gene_type:complete